MRPQFVHNLCERVLLVVSSLLTGGDHLYRMETEYGSVREFAKPLLALITAPKRVGCVFDHLNFIAARVPIAQMQLAPPGWTGTPRGVRPSCYRLAYLPASGGTCCPY